MVADSEAQRSQPGILVFDPSPTSAQMICASLRLAGYRVLYAPTPAQALELAMRHGPQGDHALVALLLDSTAQKRATAELVQSLAKLPGVEALPTLMIVHSTDPQASELSRIPRPVRAGPLLQSLRDSIEALGDADVLKELGGFSPQARLREILARHLPEARLKEPLVAAIYRALEESEDLPELSNRPNIWGSLRFMPADAVLDQLSRISASGCLSVRGPQDRLAQLYLDRGRICSASLETVRDGPNYRFGDLAVAKGLLKPKEIDAVATSCPEQFRIGQAMVAEGLINDEHCRTLLYEQTREVTTHVITWTKGRFSFVSPDPEPEPLLGARIDGVTPWPVPPLILEGLRNRDLAAMQDSNALTLEDCFVRDEQAILQLGTQCLDTDELALLELLNGRNTVRDVTRKLNVGTFKVFQVLSRLRQARLVDAQRPPHSRS